MAAPLIKLPSRNTMLAAGVELPGYIWQSPSFRFSPNGFVPSAPNLSKKPIDPDVQVRSYEAWRAGEFRSGVYCCASEPHDGRALYFAAHLVDIWQRRNPMKNVLWYSVPSSGFRNQLIDEDRGCGLLVLTNLAPTSSNVKLEKVRDLLLHYSHVPRIVVVAGEDPISFFAARLYFRLNGLFFHSERIVRRTVEVV